MAGHRQLVDIAVEVATECSMPIVLKNSFFDVVKKILGV
jgi:hypothetical protein